jgi:regulator of replication initiation timing
MAEAAEVLESPDNAAEPAIGDVVVVHALDHRPREFETLINRPGHPVVIVRWPGGDRAVGEAYARELVAAVDAFRANGDRLVEVNAALAKLREARTAHNKLLDQVDTLREHLASAREVHRQLREENEQLRRKLGAETTLSEVRLSNDEQHVDERNALRADVERLVSEREAARAQSAEYKRIADNASRGETHETNLRWEAQQHSAQFATRLALAMTWGRELLGRLAIAEVRFAGAMADRDKLAGLLARAQPFVERATEDEAAKEDAARLTAEVATLRDALRSLDHAYTRSLDVARAAKRLHRIFAGVDSCAGLIDAAAELARAMTDFDKADT